MTSCTNLTATVTPSGDLHIEWLDAENLSHVADYSRKLPGLGVMFDSDGLTIQSAGGSRRWHCDVTACHRAFRVAAAWLNQQTATPAPDAPAVDQSEQVVRLAGAAVITAEHFDRLLAADTQLRQILADTPVADRHQVAITKERLDQLEADSKALSDLRAGRDVDLSGTRARLIARSDLETLYADRSSLHRLLRGIAAGINHDPELMVTLERWVAEQDTL